MNRRIRKSQDTIREERLRLMLEGDMIKVIPQVAAPVVISIMIDAFYNLADTFFVSQLGQAATAAVAVNDVLMQIIRAIAMGFAMGAASYISRLLGAKDIRKASCVASTTMILGVSFSIIVAALSFWQMDPIINIMGATQEAKKYSIDYATWILIAAPVTTANVIMNQLLRSEGSSTFAMAGMSSGCFVNIVLDPIFITNLGLEVAGAAIATAISKVFSLFMLIIPFMKKKTVIEIKLNYFTPTWDIIREVGKMGIPACLRMSLMSVGGIITNNVARGFGTVVLAAISIANKISRMVGTVVMGLSQGANPILGYCWGGRKYQRVKEAMFTLVKMGAVLSIIIGGGLYFAADYMVSLFNVEGDPLLQQLSVLQIHAFCLALIPHQLVLVSSNLYQSLGRPVGNLVLSMSRQLLVLIPLLYVIPRLYGAEGLAVTQCISDIISFVLLCIPLTVHIMSKFWTLEDGVEPPFGKAKI